jgi:hypothetical protein
MKKHKKMKNIAYIALLVVFLMVVGIRSFQNIPLIEKILHATQSGTEDNELASVLNFQGSGCTCDAWANAGCAAGGCTAGQMYQTRTCTGTTCSGVPTSQCVADTCGAWANGGCGAGGCPVTQRLQTRTCTFGCLPASQCVDDATCCVRAAPTVSIAPSSQNTYPTGTLTYTVSVTNPDSSPCGSSTFSLSNTCPSGWTCQLSKNSVTISPGATDSSATITITSPASASAGSYTFSVTAQNQASGLSGSGSGTAVIVRSWGCDGHVSDGSCGGSENQAICPDDCKTTVSMAPNTNLIVGQPAQVTITFSDGRYRANHNVKFTLVINPEGRVWDFNNYCQYAGVILSKDGAGGTTNWSGTNIRTTSQDYSFTTTFTCKVPAGLSSGPHTLLVTPTIYSAPISLRAVQVQFTVANNQPDFNSYLTSFINAIKSFLGIK